MGVSFKQLEEMVGKTKALELWNGEGDRVADQNANLEQDTPDESMGEAKTPSHDSRCHVHIHSVRPRLADPDGISGKACIDGLVLGGILKDDSTKEVSKVTYSQEKCKKGQEKTIITLRWDDE